VTAIALRRVGIEPMVYEAYDHDADGVGAFLTLAVNGLRALGALDLTELVRTTGFDTPRMRLLSGTGRVLAEFPNGPTLPDGTMSQTLKRADLYAALRDEAVRRGIPVHYGRRLVAAEITPDRGVLARFDDGSVAGGDLLIGADGLQSRTRRIVDPGAPAARYIGLLNTGGYARGVTVPGEPGVMQMIFGRRCFFGYVPHPNGEVWWFANPPRAAEPSREELAAIPPARWRGHLLDLFRRDSSPAVELIEATAEIADGWGTYDLPSVPTWRNDRMVIVGDAAHATSPASGQGASMAIEDAVVLAKCLRDVPDIAEAFAAYERLRRDRVERVVAQGKRNGTAKAAGPVGRVVRDLVLPVVAKRLAAKNPMGWIFDHDVDWSTPVSSAAGPVRPVHSRG
jgi:2-polyprenyl-6-methoxyphenol hydroxylase-like FAD-dependent oxidoreductase